MNLQILVLVLAIVLFGVLAFKQMSALILAPLVTIFVVICSRLPILDSLKNAFMPAASDYALSSLSAHFLVLFTSILEPQNRLPERSQASAAGSSWHRSS